MAARFLSAFFSFHGEFKEFAAQNRLHALREYSILSLMIKRTAKGIYPWAWAKPMPKIKIPEAPNVKGAWE